MFSEGFWRFSKVFEGFGVTKSSHEAVLSLQMTPKTPRHDFWVINILCRGQKQRFLKVFEGFRGFRRFWSDEVELRSCFQSPNDSKNTEAWLMSDKKTSGEVTNNVFWRFLKVFEGFGATKSAYGAFSELWTAPTSPRRPPRLIPQGPHLPPTV
jgi:hypothetical protein